MKQALLVILLFGLAAIGRAAGTGSDDFNPKLLTQDRLIVILGNYADFEEAKTRAQAISKASGTPFSLQGKIYDKKRGLILPDNDPDTIYAGSYLFRRTNTMQLNGQGEETEYISIERSDAYPGLRRGYYIIVGGLYDSAKEAAKALSHYKLPAADAYAKKTQVYMGCMH